MKSILIYDPHRAPRTDGGVQERDAKSDSDTKDATTWALFLARTLTYHVIPQNPSGFTFDPRRHKCLSLGRNTNLEIYVVSIMGHELRLPCIPTELELYQWIMRRLEVLRLDNHYVGGWLHRGDFFLDVSTLVSGAAVAESFAHQQCQLMIYHPASGQNLSVAN